MAFTFDPEEPVRAEMLRLARRTLPPAQRCPENAALREAARGLASVRDAKVVVATLDRLSESFASKLPASTYAGVREQLASRVDVEGDYTPRAIEELTAIRSRVPKWRLSEGGWDALEGGLARLLPATTRGADRSGR